MADAGQEASPNMGRGLTSSRHKEWNTAKHKIQAGARQMPIEDQEASHDLSKDTLHIITLYTCQYIVILEA